MRFTLVPADAAWLTDVRMRETLMANIRDRIQDSVRDLAGSRSFQKAPRDVRVYDAGDAVLVEIRDGQGVALEKGTASRQMAQLEGSTVPIKTPQGVVFRKATRLSMILGRWNSKGLEKRQMVKGAIDRAMVGAADAVVETKRALEEGSAPRVRDILGLA